MKAVILAALAAVLTSSAASALDRPTISVVGVRAVSTGQTNVNLGQKSDYNAAAVVVLSPRAGVGIDQSGRINTSNVFVAGSRGQVDINQAGRISAASVTARQTPMFLPRGR